MKDSLYRIARDLAALYDDADPYNTSAIREFDETVEQCLDRVARETTAEDVYRGIEELTEWLGDEPEWLERINKIKERMDRFQSTKGEEK